MKLCGRKNGMILMMTHQLSTLVDYACITDEEATEIADILFKAYRRANAEFDECQDRLKTRQNTPDDESEGGE